LPPLQQGLLACADAGAAPVASACAPPPQQRQQQEAAGVALRARELLLRHPLPLSELMAGFQAEHPTAAAHLYPVRLCDAGAAVVCDVWRAADHVARSELSLTACVFAVPLLAHTPAPLTPPMPPPLCVYVLVW
jgi:hypothetical protein